MNRHTLVGLVALVIVLASCSEGVRQAEYDQKIAELALTQQELLTAREDRERAETRLAELQDRIGRLVDEVGIVVGAGQDPLDHIAEMVGALQAAEELLMTELEAAAGEAPSADVARLEALLETAATSLEWLRPGNLPEPAETARVAASVDRAGDEMVRLAYQQLVAEYLAADDRRRAELVSDLGFTAVVIGRSLIAP